MFEINLLKDRAASASVRRTIFWGVVLYLVCCIVALAWITNSGTRRLLKAGRLRKQANTAEQRFQKDHHRAQDVMAFAQGAKTRLEMDAASLETIDRLIRDRVNLVSIISALTAPLPQGANLLGLELDGKKRELSFSVVTQDGPMEKQVGSGRLAAVWNSDETLRMRLDHVRTVSTRRDRIDGEPAVIMQFSADLK